MIASTHVIVGGAVGIAVGAATHNPIAALAAGFASHLVLDAIPHFDHPDVPKVNDELVWTRAVWIFALADSIFAFLLTLFIWLNFYSFPTLTPYALGALGGYLPDLIDNVPFWKQKLRALPVFREFHAFHQRIHDWEKFLPMPRFWFLGTVTQIALVVPALIYILIG
ncbi:MAG: hypothetical protein ACM3NH_01165 [Candidatus Saccharibacteria bacterium]